MQEVESPSEHKGNMLLIRKIDEKNDNVLEAGILGRNMWEEGIFRKNEREEEIQHPCHHPPWKGNSGRRGSSLDPRLSFNRPRPTCLARASLG